ncbi:MAG: DUF1844 domain-containing protein [Syntrophus sp. (in: bacteria)]|nr:DUF1844 domain-containing protein [Syntrophus sp. (in: bacteria)]
MEGGCCCGDGASGAQGKEDAPEEALHHEDFFTGFNFSALILSLSTSVLVNLGELPDPLSNEKGMNLPLAKQTISVIEMLEDKTKGNLNADENRLINNMLYDLRMKYVEAAQK